MNINLKMVTFETDLTQFLVEADNRLEAIKKAVKANLIYDAADGDILDDINDYNNYTVADIDFEILQQIVQRNDWLICYKLKEPVIIFTN